MNKFVCIKKDDKIEIRLANVHNHSDLVLPKETCVGGGFYDVDVNERVVRLWDKSYDYGYPEFNSVNDIDEGWKDYTFYYLPDLFMPLDDCYKIEVNFVEM